MIPLYHSIYIVYTDFGGTQSMIKTLTRHGNSLALVIEKPILELLGADADTPFDISTDGQVLILTPVKDAGRRQNFQSALDKVNVKYSKALKELAE
jgi:antitoxin component of MazEF toxin-antitoxin module